VNGLQLVALAWCACAPFVAAPFARKVCFAGLAKLVAHPQVLECCGALRVEGDIRTDGGVRTRSQTSAFDWMWDTVPVSIQPTHALLCVCVCVCVCVCGCWDWYTEKAARASVSLPALMLVVSARALLEEAQDDEDVRVALHCGGVARCFAAVHFGRGPIM